MSPSSDRIRVVCVDDEPQLASLVCTYLEREDSAIDATACRTAAEAWDRLDGEEVDCVVSDYDLEHTDGIEFLREVRDTYGDLPFVLFTARGNETVASEAISAGVTEYMQKGGGTDRYRVLANRVVSVVERRRAEERLARVHRQRHDLLEVAPAAINVFDETGRILFSNPAAAELLDADSPDEVVGRSVLEIVHPEDRPEAEARLDRLFDLDRPVRQTTQQIRTFDGETKTVVVASAPTVFEGESAAIAMVVELTGAPTPADASSPVPTD